MTPTQGEYRKSTKEDKGNVAKLVDALDEYDILENTVAPRDVHPKVASLHSYEVMEAKGGADLATKAAEKARKILETHCPEPLPEDVMHTIRSLREQAEEELGLKQKYVV